MTHYLSLNSPFRFEIDKNKTIYLEKIEISYFGYKRFECLTISFIEISDKVLNFLFFKRALIKCVDALTYLQLLLISKEYTCYLLDSYHRLTDNIHRSTRKSVKDPLKFLIFKNGPIKPKGPLT
ncbi:hypothetical protein BpHYR1_018076 [Brachionus plicatilis]|uniref:Uncharacterized protein n=1 Tax=Brachionus plicatilis TaxID=10195 RepID=A0A3M7R6S6_BRAPC|nr:hypothetical protein BpHYR1_018076 [Brachionus plicatilis]